MGCLIWAKPSQTGFQRLSVVFEICVFATETLALYPRQPNQDAQVTVDAFKAEHPEIGVKWVRDGTPKLIAHLRAKRAAGAPQPELLLVADMVTLKGMKQENLLPA